MANIGLRERDRLRAWADQVVRDGFQDDAGRYPASTTFGTCLVELGAVVLQRPDADVNDAEDLLYAEPFRLIDQFVWQLAMSVAGPTEHNPKADFWCHMHQPVWDVRHDRPREIDRLALEAAVDTYLDLPVKAPFVDRLLIDMLVGCEIVAYAKVVYGKVSEYELPLYQSATIGDFLKGRAKSLGVWIVLYLIALALPFDWAPTVVLWLAVIETVISFAILPWAYRSLNRRNDKVIAPLKAMNHVYIDLDSTGAVSARHIRDQATKAADAGVGWPGPLFALLDDALERGGRL